MRILIALALIASLFGCATADLTERSVQMQNEVNQMIQVYGPACEKLGYQPNSDQWRDCILKLNTSKVLENYSNQPVTTQCWRHRGFYQCSSF